MLGRPCPDGQARFWSANPFAADARSGTLSSVNSYGGVFAPAHRALTLGILLSITAVACEGMAVATIMPSVAVELGGLEAYGWAFSAFMLASLASAWLILVAASFEVLPAVIAIGVVGFVVAVPALRALLPRGTVTAHNGMPASVALRGLLAFAFFSSEAVIPLGLSTERNLPPSLVGIALTAGAGMGLTYPARR
jgi:hypothetical protein